MYGMTRGTATLLGVAVAGLLLWLASQFDADVTREYWAGIGLVAAAGLTMALSQLLGGWTKWGMPRLSSGVFLLGFLPVLVAGGLVVLHAQPDSGSLGAGWAGDLGAGDLADDLARVLPAIAFGVGLTFGLTFDTAPRRVPSADETVAREGYFGPVDRERTIDADEPVLAEREAVAAGPTDRDGDGVDDRTEEYEGADRPRRGVLRR